MDHPAPKVESDAPANDGLSEYRKHLQSAEQKSQEDFDKTVLSLSGGALGISFVFLKDVIGPNPVVEPNLLFAAWVSWGCSTFCVLSSYYTSHLALRKAIRQVDEGDIRNGPPGGTHSFVTAVLNALGAVLFLAGVCTITLFAHANLKSKEEIDALVKNAAPATASPNSPAPTSASAPASGTGVQRRQ